jgi:hypothetical protein
MPLYPVVAGGNIHPSRILVASAVQPNQVLEASNATTQPVGISQKGTWKTPLQGFDDGLAAVAGGNLHIYSNGDTCPLEIGGTVTQGDILMSDGSGRGITATTTNWGIAKASKSAVLGDIIEVQVLIGYVK